MFWKINWVQEGTSLKNLLKQSSASRCLAKGFFLSQNDTSQFKDAGIVEAISLRFNRAICIFFVLITASEELQLQLESVSLVFSLIQLSCAGLRR